MYGMGRHRFERNLHFPCVRLAKPCTILLKVSYSCHYCNSPYMYVLLDPKNFSSCEFGSLEIIYIRIKF